MQRWQGARAGRAAGGRAVLQGGSKAAAGARGAGRRPAGVRLWSPSRRGAAAARRQRWGHALGGAGRVGSSAPELVLVPGGAAPLRLLCRLSKICHAARGAQPAAGPARAGRAAARACSPRRRRSCGGRRGGRRVRQKGPRAGPSPSSTVNRPACLRADRRGRGAGGGPAGRARRKGASSTPLAARREGRKGRDRRAPRRRRGGRRIHGRGSGRGALLRCVRAPPPGSRRGSLASGRRARASRGGQGGRRPGKGRVASWRCASFAFSDAKTTEVGEGIRSLFDGIA